MIGTCLNIIYEYTLMLCPEKPWGPWWFPNSALKLAFSYAISHIATFRMS